MSFAYQFSILNYAWSIDYENWKLNMMSFPRSVWFEFSLDLVITRMRIFLLLIFLQGIGVSFGQEPNKTRINVGEFLIGFFMIQLLIQFSKFSSWKSGKFQRTFWPLLLIRWWGFIHRSTWISRMLFLILKMLGNLVRCFAKFIMKFITKSITFQCAISWRPKAYRW